MYFVNHRSIKMQALKQSGFKNPERSALVANQISGYVSGIKTKEWLTSKVPNTGTPMSEVIANEIKENAGNNTFKTKIQDKDYEISIEPYTCTVFSAEEIYISHQQQKGVQPLPERSFFPEKFLTDSKDHLFFWGADIYYYDHKEDTFRTLASSKSETYAELSGIMRTAIKNNSTDLQNNIALQKILANAGHSDLITVKELSNKDKPEYKFVLTQNEEIFATKTSSHVAFNAKSITPRQLQYNAMMAYANSISDGKSQRVAELGTGTGKSFILAGLLHAVEGGVSIVPNTALAEETKKDALEALDKMKSTMRVVLSVECNVLYAESGKIDEIQSLRDFQKAIEQGTYMILTPDDPLFIEKVKLTRGRLFIIDEAHQIALNEYYRQVLDIIRTNNNAALYVSGTIDQDTLNILDPDKLGVVCTQGLAEVTEAGILRQVEYEKNPQPVPSDDLIKKGLTEYFTGNTYLTTQPGAFTIDRIKKEVQENPENEEEIIKQAIKQNCKRRSAEKNFVFSGDAELRKNIQKQYEDVCNGEYPEDEMQILLRNIAHNRYANELETRKEILTGLHDDWDEDRIEKEAAKQTVEITLTKEEFSNELKLDQKTIIAQSINAFALSVLLGGKKETYEKLWRTGELDKYITKNQEKIASAVVQHEALDKIAPGLPAEQRKAYIEAVEHAIIELKKGSGILKPDVINLNALDAKYTGSASAAEDQVQHDKENAKVLDQLRCGLVMHVFSGKDFTTGISIQNLFSVQQYIGNTKDPLNNFFDVAQLLGRVIRSDDGRAFASQIISEDVDKDSIVKIFMLYEKEPLKAMTAYSDYVAKRKQDHQDEKNKNPAMQKKEEEIPSKQRGEQSQPSQPIKNKVALISKDLSTELGGLINTLNIERGKKDGVDRTKDRKYNALHAIQLLLNNAPLDSVAIYEKIKESLHTGNIIQGIITHRTKDILYKLETEIAQKSVPGTLFNHKQLYLLNQAINNLQLEINSDSGNEKKLSKLVVLQNILKAGTSNINRSVDVQKLSSLIDNALNSQDSDSQLIRSGFFRHHTLDVLNELKDKIVQKPAASELKK